MLLRPLLKLKLIFSEWNKAITFWPIFPSALNKMRQNRANWNPLQPSDLSGLERCLEHPHDGVPLLNTVVPILFPRDRDIQYKATRLG